MKGAAKRDSLCELQNSVNQWPPERALHSWDFLRVCLLQCLVWSTLFGSCFWEPSTFVNHWNRERERERERTSSATPLFCQWFACISTFGVAQAYVRCCLMHLSLCGINAILHQAHLYACYCYCAAESCYMHMYTMCILCLYDYSLAQPIA